MNNIEEKLEFIKQAIKTITNESIDLSLDTLLIDLGLDSLDIVELQLYYEEHTGHEIANDVIIKSVEDLVNVMK